MNLSNFKLLPAVIDNVNDPEKIGRVKCTIPGITDNSMICDDNMPWVNPLTMSGYQQFSNPIQGQKVWVLVDNNDNKNLWYIPLFEYIDITEDFVKEKYNNNAEVIFARNLGGQKAMFTYDDKDGIVLELRNSKVHLKQDGDIEIKSNDSNVRITGGVVYCGKEGENYEKAVYGERLVRLLENLRTEIEKLSGIANVYPTNHLSVPLSNVAMTIDTKDLLCEHTKVN